MLILPILALLPLPVAAAAVDYTREIKPLLKERCYACHGVLAQKARLRLDAGSLILQGGRHGPAIRPGDPANSLLLARVSSADESAPPSATPSGSPTPSTPLSRRGRTATG